MAAELGSGFRLAVLNPGGSDREQDFAGSISTGVTHAPVNFHAYAACTGGTFFRDAARAGATGWPVLLLLRGDFRTAERALESLQNAGRMVAVSLKETGLHQIAAQLSDPARLTRLIKIVGQADGCLAPTPEAADLYRDVRRKGEGIAFIPTPYPLHDAQWDFSIGAEQRDGIFVGTREWQVPSRNHAMAVLTARHLSERTGARVTVYNVDGRRGERLLSRVGFAADRLRVLRRRVGYAEYLRSVAQHKVVLQMDTSFVPGQVAGDGLLCRLPCVGGNGAVDRLGHPQTCGAGRSGAELVELAARLLTDSDFYQRTVAESQRHAREQLSFGGAAKQLARFFSQFPLRPTPAA